MPDMYRDHDTLLPLSVISPFWQPVQSVDRQVTKGHLMVLTTALWMPVDPCVSNCGNKHQMLYFAAPMFDMASFHCLPDQNTGWYAVQLKAISIPSCKTLYLNTFLLNPEP